MAARHVLTWVDPQGHVHDVPAQHLRAFCDARGLHASNLQNHVDNQESDQKCGGWCLIERLRWLQRVEQPEFKVPALGTIDSFYQACLTA